MFESQCLHQYASLEYRRSSFWFAQDRIARQAFALLEPRRPSLSFADSAMLHLLPESLFQERLELYRRVFFKLLFEIGHFGSGARLVHFCWTLIAEPSEIKKPVIGTRMSITHAVPLSNCPLQVRYSPELTITCSRRCSKQVGWRVHSQSFSQLVDLCLAQLSPITALALINQFLDTAKLICTAPIHEALRDIVKCCGSKSPRRRISME